MYPSGLSAETCDTSRGSFFKIRCAIQGKIIAKAQLKEGGNLLYTLLNPRKSQRISSFFGFRRKIPDSTSLIQGLKGGLAMATDFKSGDHVERNSEAGRVRGTIEKKITSEITFKGYKVHASKEEPQFLIKSDKTDHMAMHKGSVLKKLKKGQPDSVAPRIHSIFANTRRGQLQSNALFARLEVLCLCLR